MSSTQMAAEKKSTLNIIKVMGVGGGGGNAVNHMYNKGIAGVEFFVCNTDKQALEASPVPNKISLGKDLTEGLGAGANPEIGRKAAEESKDEIKAALSGDTKMVFITAGMGGGTGTGAAPVVAEVAKSMGMLTVGIVTVPFKFEGSPKSRKANDGIEELKKSCDTVLVIINDKLREVYGKLSMKQAFGHADNVLTNAAKSIAELVSLDAYINVDFEDVKTVMLNSGSAVMGTAIEEGEGRATKAAEAAINSPLLNNTNIKGAQKILLHIGAHEDDLGMEEMEEITDYITQKSGSNSEIIFGVAFDEALEGKISVTIIATGFDSIVEEEEPEVEKQQVTDLLSEKKTLRHISQPKEEFFTDQPDEVASIITQQENTPEPEPEKPQKVVFNLEDDLMAEDAEKKKLDEELKARHERLARLKAVSQMSPEELREKQNVPAYMRKGINLGDDSTPSEEKPSRFSVNKNDDLLGDNRFLHDNVD